MISSLSRQNLEAIGVKYSKNGYIIASKKNLERILANVTLAAAREMHFDGMTDGMSSRESCTLLEGIATAEDVIAAKRFGRGIAIYEDRNELSIGDCCYDVTFSLSA